LVVQKQQVAGDLQARIAQLRLGEKPKQGQGAELLGCGGLVNDALQHGAVLSEARLSRY